MIMAVDRQVAVDGADMRVQGRFLSVFLVANGALEVNC